MNPVTLFLCGDVMTGRGIDQILPQPCDPAIHEPYMDSALGYVQLAEEANGPIPRPVDASYIWGDALAEFQRVKPQARIINLETAVTCSEDRMAKGINYRMNPANISCLTAAGIDCCALANNHVLDWGMSGLTETLATLNAARIKTAGAGTSEDEAWAPAVLPLADNRRVFVFSFGTATSGIPKSWAITGTKGGVAFLPDLEQHTVQRIALAVRTHKRPGDLVVVSVHWGGNWGYDIAADEVRFAHALIDGGADLFHGHSSHHPKGVEVFHDRLVVYGCGDFINDYEGISGYEAFRGDLGLMYFPTLDADTGRLLRLEVVATQMKRMRVQRASAADSRWLRALLDREGRRFGTWTEVAEDHLIELQWRKGRDSRVPSP
jgi:poly-gamma-glutamate synthesis protein (capsule biosynthesis protein)